MVAAAMTHFGIDPRAPTGTSRGTKAYQGPDGKRRDQLQTDAAGRPVHHNAAGKLAGVFRVANRHFGRIAGSPEMTATLP